MVKNSRHGGTKTLGKLFQLYLPAKTHRIYSCLHCRAQLANHDELISKVSRLRDIAIENNFLDFSPFKVVKAEHIYSIQCMLSSLINGIFTFLFISVNVNTSAAEERILLTGLHEVADIYCECCKTLLGWKYVSIQANS